MCGRYTFSHEDKLAKRFDLKAVSKDIRPNWNVAPTQTMPVVTASENGRELQEMRWGIPRFIGEGKTVDVFNTRADKAFGSWKKLTMTQRLLIPASGFYEWKKMSDGKQPFYIHPKDEELFAFAGVWNEWLDKESGTKIKVYSILTTEPNKEMSGIHNRMPVILHRSDESAWLSPSNDNDRNAIEDLLRPYEDNGLDIYEVSRDVNVVRNNSDKLIYPLNSQ
jgi:putative SOS response-associated peptidase YedK